MHCIIQSKLLNGFCSFFAMRVIILFLIHLFHSSSSQKTGPTIEFNKSFIGTVFQPYNSHASMKFDAYKFDDVEAMLSLVATKFRIVTTYGMGVTQSGHPEGAVGFTAVEAARINAKSSSKSNILLRVDLGCHHDGELNYAFQQAVYANGIARGTVHGIIVATIFDLTDATIQLVSKLLRIAVDQNSGPNERPRLKLGIRTTTCDILSVQTNKVSQSSWRNLNFIICHKMPTPEASIELSARTVTQNFLLWREKIQSEFPNLEVYGQTGFPSSGITQEGLEGSVNNMRTFWSYVSKWSMENNFRIDLFTAFDEPWKQNLPNPASAEIHYGWWRRVNYDRHDAIAFEEKLLVSQQQENKVVNKNDVHHRESVSYVILILLGVIAVVVVAAIFGAIYYLYRRLNYVQSKLTDEDIREFKNGTPKKDDSSTIEDALRQPYNKKYELTKEQIYIDKDCLLGSGQFGTVFKGKLEGDANDVAIKLPQPNCTSSNLKSMLSEIKIMIYVGQHPNIVSILGAYTREIRQGNVIIAIEICPRGSLDKYLRSQKSSIFMESGYQNVKYLAKEQTNSQIEELKRKLMKWSYEIANGMEYIASKKIIHADLATRNVLLGPDETAKITDFGLSRRLYEYTNYVKQNQEPLPWRWMAIESLRNLSFSTKSDVWSFGVTLWEIHSLGDVPYPGLTWSNEFLLQVEEQGYRLGQPDLATKKTYELMLQCWILAPELRPNFTTLKNALRMQMNEGQNN